MAIIDEHSALACPNQQFPEAKWQKRRDQSCFRIRWIKLAEAEAVECDDAFRQRSDQELRFFGIFQPAGRDPQQRRGRQLLPGTIMLEQRAAIVIAKKARSATEIKLTFEDSRAGEGFRSVDPFKIAFHR